MCANVHVCVLVYVYACVYVPMGVCFRVCPPMHTHVPVNLCVSVCVPSISHSGLEHWPNVLAVNQPFLQVLTAEGGGGGRQLSRTLVPIPSKIGALCGVTLSPYASTHTKREIVV